MDQPEKDVGAAGAQRQHADQEGQGEQHNVERGKPEHKLLVEFVGGDGDGRNRQTDGGKRRAEREVDTLLQLVPLRRNDRRGWPPEPSPSPPRPSPLPKPLRPGDNPRRAREKSRKIIAKTDDWRILLRLPLYRPGAGRLCRAREQSHVGPGRVMAVLPKRPGFMLFAISAR